MMNEKNTIEPEVTILLATYNGERYIDELMESILAQSYGNWKLLVSDDVSTDSTLKHLEKYIALYPEKIFLVNTEKKFGSAKENFLYLLSKSTSDYIMFCDQDDIWLPFKISLTLDLMLSIVKDKKVPVLIHTDLKVADAELNVIDDSFMQYSQLDFKRNKLNNLIIQNIVTGCTTMINSKLKDKICFDESHSENILMHDWYLALIASAFGEIRFLNKPTIFYRQHGDNSVGAKKKDIGFILNKLKNNDMKKSMHDTMRQAGCFAEAFKSELTTEDYALCKEYSELIDASKYNKIRFFLKNKVFKYDFSRMVAQFIWA